MWYNPIMFAFLKKTDSESQKLLKTAKQALEANRGVIESLRDYDAGKKDISTDTAERRLPNIRVAS